MKQVIIAYLLPFSLSLLVVYNIAQNKQLNNYLFENNPGLETKKQKAKFVASLSDNEFFEKQFLKKINDSETIFLLGSSELTNSSEAIPYNYISNHFTTQIIAVGHAGNQCLSIYSQLLANKNRLKNAPLIIIVSPGWFESKPSKGTSSEVFLEFNSERYLNRIIKDEHETIFNAYLFKRISQLYCEFNSPNLEIKLMNFKYRASQSFFHKICYSPLIYCDNLVLDLKEKMLPQTEPEDEPFKRKPIISDSVSVNWDSLFARSKADVIRKVTNNNLGIADDYYTQAIHGKSGHIEPVSEMFNQELEDYKMLIKILKEKNVNASFIISPLNPLYYRNLKDMAPTVNIIENEMKKNGFPVLNLFETDTSRYDKAILQDVMHMSDYAWYQVNHFIINTYHLNR